jgi:hypothetical protein
MGVLPSPNESDGSNADATVACLQMDHARGGLGKM